MRSREEVWGLLDPLFGDIPEDHIYSHSSPRLAHYTTMFAFEQILRQDGALWFSNPLLMNDVQETTLALNEGVRFYLASDIREAFTLKADADAFERALNHTYQLFFSHMAFDTYILCLCEHRADDTDGLLSMWRGYGDSGKGVALVLNGTSIEATPSSPMIVSKIHYTDEAGRRLWYHQSAAKFAALVEQHAFTGHEEAYYAAQLLFSRLRMFALFTKHKGFSEEREWRIAYLPERDGQNRLRPYLSYFNGPKGVEPKLKLPFRKSPAFGEADVSPEAIVERIILGPNRSSHLTEMSTKRMLENLGRQALVERVVASSIPYRV